MNIETYMMDYSHFPLILCYSINDVITAVGLLFETT